MQKPSEKRGRAIEDERQSLGMKRTMVRKRAALACEECRVRKRRCDGTIPACGGCKKRMALCVYSAEVEAREWHYSMIQSLRTRLEEMEKAAVSIPMTERHPATADNSTVPRGPVEGNQTTSLRSAPRPGLSGNADLSNPAETVQFAGLRPATSLVTKSAAPNDCEVDDATLSSVIQSGAAQIECPPRCIQPCSFEMLMKPIDQAMNRKSDSVRSALILPADSAWPSAVSSGPRIVSTRCTCDRFLNVARWCLPLRRQADDLVAIYFSRHHRMFPILHQPTFMKQYERLWESRASTQTTQMADCAGLCMQKSRGKSFPATVHTVFALGSLFQSGSAEQNAARADAFYRPAQAIDLLEVLDEEVGLELVQLGLLMGFYLQSTERFSKCWNISGLTIRMAQNMGLHLDFAEAHKRMLFGSNPTQLECAMRTRVWYGCVLLETDISMSFGQPLMIPKGGTRFDRPEIIDDDRLSDETGNWKAQPESMPSLMEYYVQTIKLYEILRRVLDRDGLVMETSSEATSFDFRAVLSLDTQVMEWHCQLPPYLKCETFAKESDSPKAGTVQAVVTSQEVLDLPALAKRLHCRFLHTRQLVLRPALEHLFEEQQHEQQCTTDKSMEARLQDAMLSDIGLQCVLSAKSLVDFLAVQMQLHNFTCWWYNISYLHTCGSTILMGRLCIFGDIGISDESLLISWERCLHFLSRYTEMSNIAKRCAQLLQKGANRLLSRNHQQTILQSTNEKSSLPRIQESDVQSPCDSGETLHPRTNLLETPCESHGCSHIAEIIPGQDLVPGVDLYGNGLDIFGIDTWDSDIYGTSSWPFIPSLAQLETFPQNSGTTDIAR